MVALKFICLVIAIVYSFVNIGKLIRGHAVGTLGIFLMAVGIVGFLFIQFSLF